MERGLALPGQSGYREHMGELKFGPARVPSKKSPEAAVELLLERGYNACEIDFAGGFWMDYPWDERLGELAREAGIAKTAGAELVVFHPGFLLERTRELALDAVCEQLGELRTRLEEKDRAVPFGVEVMGRVRDLGTVDDVLEISRRAAWVRPVLDFAHMHATSDGALTSVEPFAQALEAADAILEPGVPFHIHFSDIAFANRNETKHLPYGEGTLRAEPLAEALKRF